MVDYEGMFIIDPNVSGGAPKEAVKWLSDTIANYGGRVDNLNEWGKRRFAYLVKKQE